MVYTYDGAKRKKKKKYNISKLETVLVAVDWYIQTITSSHPQPIYVYIQPRPTTPISPSKLYTLKIASTWNLHPQHAINSDDHSMPTQTVTTHSSQSRSLVHYTKEYGNVQWQ